MAIQQSQYLTRSASSFKTTSPRLILEDYIQLNEGVADRETLIQLAPFALRPKIGNKRVSNLFPIHSSTPVRHRPWFIWNTLRLAGLERHWYAGELNRKEITWKVWVGRIQRGSTEEERERWCRLLYRTSLPKPSGRDRTSRLWTRGGGWPPRMGMSRVLVMHEHLERDPPTWGPYEVMDEDRIRMVEREVMVHADPDRFIYPEAYHQATHYVRARWKELTGKRLGWEKMPWFWQMDVVDEGGVWWQRSGHAARNHARLSIAW